jgi:hypothetical protein
MKTGRAVHIASLTAEALPLAWTQSTGLSRHHASADATIFVMRVTIVIGAQLTRILHNKCKAVRRDRFIRCTAPKSASKGLLWVLAVWKRMFSKIDSKLSD